MTTGIEAPGRLMEPTVFAQPEGVRTLVAEVGSGIVGLCHACSPKKQSGNEDSVAVAPWGPDGALLMIADGCGGHVAGAEAAGESIAALVDARDHRDPETDQATAMIDAIWEANRRVIALQRGAACTLAVVGIEGRVARPAHVGDSEIVIVGQRGRERFRTIAHSPTGYMLEAGLIDETEALTHKDRHVVSNVVGTDEMRIDVGPTIELASRDTVLVASDGLFDNLLLDEIKEIIRKGPIDEVVSGLLAAAWARMTEPQEGMPSKRDDLSFAVFRLA